MAESPKPERIRFKMKFALLMSNGETVALASRLAAVGITPCIAAPNEALPLSDLLIFDESVPLTSPDAKRNTFRLISEALSARKPVMAVLTDNAPVSPKCALTVNELLGFSSMAVVTPAGAREILGLDGEYESDPLIGETFGGDPVLSEAAALARDLVTAHELSFSLLFLPEENRGILYTGEAYDVIEAETLENAIAEIFRTA